MTKTDKSCMLQEILKCEPKYRKFRKGTFFTFYTLRI